MEVSARAVQGGARHVSDSAVAGLARTSVWRGLRFSRMWRRFAPAERVTRHPFQVGVCKHDVSRCKRACTAGIEVLMGKRRAFRTRTIAFRVTDTDFDRLRSLAEASQQPLGE